PKTLAPGAVRSVVPMAPPLTDHWAAVTLCWRVLITAGTSSCAYVLLWRAVPTSGPAAPQEPRTRARMTPCTRVERSPDQVRPEVRTPSTAWRNARADLSTTG